MPDSDSMGEEAVDDGIALVGAPFTAARATILIPFFRSNPLEAWESPGISDIGARNESAGWRAAASPFEAFPPFISSVFSGDSARCRTWACVPGSEAWASIAGSKQFDIFELEELACTIFDLGSAVFHVTISFGRGVAKNQPEPEPKDWHAVLDQLDDLRRLRAGGAHGGEKPLVAFAKAVMGPGWQVLSNSGRLPAMCALLQDGVGQCSLPAWYAMLSLAPPYNADDRMRPNAPELAQMAKLLTDGIVADHWHCAPPEVRGDLLVLGKTGIFAEQAIRGPLHTRRGANSAWSVGRIGRSFLVVAGAARKANGNRGDIYRLWIEPSQFPVLGIGVLVQAQRCALQLLNVAVGEAARRDDRQREAATLAVQKKMIDFATSYVHRSLNMREDVEVYYRAWMEKLEIEQEARTVTEDVARLYGLVQAERGVRLAQSQEKLAHTATNLSILAFVGAIAAVVTGIFGMNILIDSSATLDKQLATFFLVSGGVVAVASRLAGWLLKDGHDPRLPSILKALFLVGAGLLGAGAVAYLAWAPPWPPA